MSVTFVRAASLAALLLGAQGVASCKPATASPTGEPGAAASASAAAAAVDVVTVEVREEPMPRSLQLTGTLKGAQQTDLAANAMGRVVATFVERGAVVKKGEKLAVLDVRSAAATASEVRASVALARAQSEAAQRECERYAKLAEQNVIAPAERDRMNDQCRTSALSVRAAEARAGTVGIAIGDGTITAPFAGVVVQRFANVGDYLRHDSRVVTLVSLEPLRLEFSVPEASLADVKEGGTLTFTVPAYGERSFPATVRFVGGAVREATRDLVAEAVVEDPERALRAGMFATVALRTGETPSAVLPRSALFEKDDGHRRVLAVVNHRIEERIVQVGAEKGDLVAIVRGVVKGDVVVSAPTSALRNGQAVN